MILTSGLREPIYLLINENLCTFLLRRNLASELVTASIVNHEMNAKQLDIAVIKRNIYWHSEAGKRMSEMQLLQLIL